MKGIHMISFSYTKAVFCTQREKCFLSPHGGPCMLSWKGTNCWGSHRCLPHTEALHNQDYKGSESHLRLEKKKKNHKDSCRKLHHKLFCSCLNGFYHISPHRKVLIRRIWHKSNSFPPPHKNTIKKNSSASSENLCCYNCCMQQVTLLCTYLSLTCQPPLVERPCSGHSVFHSVAVVFCPPCRLALLLIFIESLVNCYQSLTMRESTKNWEESSLARGSQLTLEVFFKRVL